MNDFLTWLAIVNFLLAMSFFSLLIWIRMKIRANKIKRLFFEFWKREVNGFVTDTETIQWWMYNTKTDSLYQVFEPAEIIDSDRVILICCAQGNQITKWYI